jgi:tocopherol cyclase
VSLLQIWRPASYHGRRMRRDFFEGWYFKFVDAAEDHVFAVIPGVFLGRQAGASYSFVQTIDGSSGQTTFHRYPLEAFVAARREFHVEIGPNCFSSDRLSLDIDTPERRLKGDLRFSMLTPWPVTLAAPGIMGPYAFAPFMECYHGVVSLDHVIGGQLEIDGTAVDFTGGRGYTEKDWGVAFPQAWIWMQSNHFEQPGTCLTASVARIPWLGRAFRGFIVGFWHGGRLYRFATYSGARILNLDLTDRMITWRMEGRAGGRGDTAIYGLNLRASRAEGGLLHGPFRTDMLQRVSESLTAMVNVTLTRVRAGGDEQVYTGTGRHAGLEINGRLEEILG